MMPALCLVSSRHSIPRRPGSDADVGPFINVVTWILLITSALAVLTRLITKRVLRRRIDIDDAFVVLALTASIASGAAVSIQTENGLGRDISLLTTGQIVAYRKAEYANNMLYIATLGFAKLSIISLLMMLTASKLHRNLGLALACFIALWAVFSICVSAFQCGTIEPWRFLGNNRICFDIVSFWRAMGVVNILTDLALIGFPMHVVITLQMSTTKKITILTFFGARSLDIVATSVQMLYLSGFSSANPTWHLWKWTLLAQIIQCITIITSCVPYIRPLLESVPSGLYASDDLRRRGTSSDHCGAVSRAKNNNNNNSASSSYQLSSIASRFHTGLPRKPPIPIHAPATRTRSFWPSSLLLAAQPQPQPQTTHATSATGVPGGPRRLDGETDVEITAVLHTQREEKRWDAASTASHSKILRTTVVSAEWEEAEAQEDRVKVKVSGVGRGGEADEIEVVR
ncbi:hypothetical protein ACJQWK_00761 [Exserohilum turcicum]